MFKWAITYIPVHGPLSRLDARRPKLICVLAKEYEGVWQWLSPLIQVGNVVTKVERMEYVGTLDVPVLEDPQVVQETPRRGYFRRAWEKIKR